eukprot:6903800-Pyramimonas_sp.AAC.2
MCRRRRLTSSGTGPRRYSLRRTWRPADWTSPTCAASSTTRLAQTSKHDYQIECSRGSQRISGCNRITSYLYRR